MNDILRRTIQSFLRKEGPRDRDEAIALLGDWFSRYGIDDDTLAEEADRHFKTLDGGRKQPVLQ